MHPPPKKMQLLANIMLAAGKTGHWKKDALPYIPDGSP